MLARGNLDADRAAETLAELEGPVDCAHSAFVARMEIQDACARRLRTFSISDAYRRPEERLDDGRIVEADELRGRREAFFVVHGATTATGEAAVVHLVVARRGACPRPRFLFRYQPSLDVQSFDVELGNFESRFPGLEVRVREKADPYEYVRIYRFDRLRDRYIACCSR